ncbi:MAG: helix-turn-helix domain-containing protein [Pyrinomonadaceae bacterium]
MSLTLGDKLRQAREERGISISEVSEQTRISSLYLDAIENDKYKTLPGGIFNKGFVKSYAKFIGFDEQEALHDYAQLVAASEGTENDHLPTYRPEVLTDDRNGASIVPTVIFAVIILALMTGGVLFLVNYIQSRPDTPALVSNTSNSSGANAANAINSNPQQSTASAPVMETLKVEFKTTGEDISLTAFNDGKKSYGTITSAKAAIFEPKQQLRLSYSRSKVRAAQLIINGKEIALPSTPENPRRAAIEFDINKENLAQIWESGAISFAAGAQMPSASKGVNTTTVRPQAPVQTATPASTAQPQGRPAPTPVVRRGTPIPARPPIIVGNTGRRVN